MKGQVNVQMNQYDGIKQAKGFRDILVPLMWFSGEDVGTTGIMDPELIQRIKDEL